MPSIFDNVNFINESSNSYSKKNKIYNESGIVKDCDIFITEEMIMECSNDNSLIRQQALLEGAKFDLWLKNFLKEGEDYKGLKKELKTIVDANDLSDEKLYTGRKGVMHAIKRVLQVLYDIGLIAGTVGGVIQVTAMIVFPPMFIGGVLGLIIGILINRLLRLAWDTVEFEAVKKDSEDIVSKLRSMAEKTKNASIAKKYNSEADRLEKAIEKYSEKK